MRKTISLEQQHAPVPFQAGDVDERVFLDVLDEVVVALSEADIPFGFLGGIASATLGRPRYTQDLDVFVRQQDAGRVLTALGARGFETQETNPHWIYKAFKHGVLVDILFRAKGEIYLDDEMISRIVRTTFKGHPVRVVPPEDLIVIKAIIHDEDTPRHWYDALGVLAAHECDWDYFIRRASASGARRVLSLLTYAQSVDLVVPDPVIRGLMEVAYPL